ncbi:uncharacterized protein LOC130049597 [Ostrea edulis]|uniref:uncharacterized protein LOC130049597 n=1 Tax=Ostrea edulis TaxID=37623 RepID=UPI0024AEA8F3|nr:uncharacterized protein LOC130049597 [Ostrea edulis]
MCVSTEHRKCESVDAIKKTAETLREILSHNFDSLSEDIHILENKLVDAKKEQERFVTEMDDKADQITENTTREFRVAIDHLQHLKNEYLTKMATAVKRNKEKYEKCIDTLSDGIQCTDYCYRNIEDCRKSQDDIDMVVKYYKSRKIFEQLKNYEFTQIRIGLKEGKDPILEDIMDLESFPDAVFSESLFDVKSDLRRVELSLLNDFSIDAGCVRDGTFLSNGEFVLSWLSTKRRGCKRSNNGKCFFYNKVFACTRSIDLSSEPFGLCEKARELLVACHGSRSIERVSLYSYSKSSNMKFTSLHKNFGIAKKDAYLYCACNDKIVKINEYERLMKEYSVETGVKHIVATKNHIIYSNRKKHVVTAITDGGQTAWTYDSPHLKSPCGLDTDSDGNIYVAGKSSDNVHVLSGEGKLIRLFEDIPRPDFMKINKARNTCCVCSNRKHIKVYQFK